MFLGPSDYKTSVTFPFLAVKPGYIQGSYTQDSYFWRRIPLRWGYVIYQRFHLSFVRSADLLSHHSRSLLMFNHKALSCFNPVSSNDSSLSSAGFESFADRFPVLLLFCPRVRLRRHRILQLPPLPSSTTAVASCIWSIHGCHGVRTWARVVSRLLVQHACSYNRSCNSNNYLMD
jgi:hypothetical protein